MQMGFTHALPHPVDTTEQELLNKKPRLALLVPLACLPALGIGAGHALRTGPRPFVRPQTQATRPT